MENGNIAAPPAAMPPRKSRLGRVLLMSGLGLVGLLLAGAFGVSLWARSYCRSEEFRQLVSEATATALHAEGEFEPLHWSGSGVHSDQFQAQGKPEAWFTRLRAEQIRAELNLWAALRRVWQIDQFEIQRLQIETDAKAPRPAASPPPKSSWRLDWGALVIREGTLSWNAQSPTAGAVEKARLTIRPDGTAYTVRGSGGTLRQMGWPTLEIEDFLLRYQPGRLYVTDAQLKLPRAGRVGVSGEMGLEGDSRYDLQVKFSGLPTEMFVTEDWRAKLSGNVWGTARVQGARQQPGSAQVRGTLHLRDGQLEAVPVLDAIGLFAHTQQFRRVALQTGEADFIWTAAKLTVPRLVLESKGLVRFEGQFTVEKEIIDGQFQVGLNPAHLRWIPVGQAKVFTVERDGYAWAPMRLTGPVSNPKEDLSARLLAAAQSDVIEGVEGAVKKGTELLDLVTPLLR